MDVLGASSNTVATTPTPILVIQLHPPSQLFFTGWGGDVGSFATAAHRKNHTNMSRALHGSLGCKCLELRLSFEITPFLGNEPIRVEQRGCQPVLVWARTSMFITCCLRCDFWRQWTHISRDLPRPLPTRTFYVRPCHVCRRTPPLGGKIWRLELGMVLQIL